LQIAVLDVGQAEAMLVRFPDGTAMLVDAGGSPFGSGGFDVGGRVLAPALRAHGVRRVRTLVVTHGDPDHLGGALPLLDLFRPSEVWEGVPVPGHPEMQRVQARAAALGARLLVRRRGHEESRAGVRIRVLHPPEPEWERPRVRNDDSIVMELVSGDVAVLLTGDISAAVERDVVPRLTPARIRVLKVAHHGSRTSSSATLLEAWRPQIAVLSAGRGNTFGHPAAEVLRRLEDLGAAVYRTDRDGQIALEIDGRSALVTTVRSS
jgi:competence protein ComEC